MPYSTLDDLKKLIPEEILIQLTDDEMAGNVNQDRINEAIAQADSVIDSYCGAKYKVPLTAPAPDVVKTCSVDIAIYNLYSRRTEELPSTRSDRYKNSIRLLEKIAEGKISIGVDPAPAAPSSGQPESNKTSSDRVFTRDKMRGF